MQIWKAHYKDQYNDTYIDIVNTEEDSKHYIMNLPLYDISKQMAQDYYMKCCFTCQYR